MLRGNPEKRLLLSDVCCVELGGSEVLKSGDIFYILIYMFLAEVSFILLLLHVFSCIND